MTLVGFGKVIIDKCARGAEMSPLKALNATAFILTE